MKTSLMLRSITTRKILIQRMFTASMSSDSKPPKRSEHLDLTKSQFRMNQMLDASITKIQELSPTVKGFTLTVKQKEATFKAGQWVDFFIPGIEKVGGFSMCSSPDLLIKQNQLELAIKKSEWPPANWLWNKAEINSKVQMRVGGDFYYPIKDLNEDHNVLLIAGGVGINPLLSIMRAINDAKTENRDSARKVKLHFSAQTREELLFKNDIDRICAENDDFSVRYYVTQSNEEDFDRKRIGPKDLEESLTEMKSFGRTLCFICGPTEMIKNTDRNLQSLGIPKSDIFYELWW